MAIITDTNRLQKFNPKGYPAIEGGEAQYLANQFAVISNAINIIVDTMKRMETRMNNNGLT